MDDRLFWSIIEETKCEDDPDLEKQPRAIAKRIRALSDSELAQFRDALDFWAGKLARWDLASVCLLMEGFVSDDVFDDWCSGLLLQGKSVVESTLEDPEYLSSYPHFSTCENLIDVLVDEYERRPKLPTKSAVISVAEKQTGKSPFERVRDVHAKFPRLSKRYWGRWPYGSPCYPDAQPLE